MSDLIYPKVAWLTLTHNCNFKCSWCYAKKYCYGHNDMDFKKAKKTIDALAEAGIKKVILTGGEPTFYPKLTDILSCIKKMDMRCGIVTNGVALENKECACEIIRLGVSSCNISIKGISEAQYLCNVGSTGLFRSLEGYKNMVKYGCDTIISYVVSKPDIMMLKKLRELLDKNNIDRISFLMEKPSVFSTEQNTSLISDLAKCCEYIFEVFENSGIEYKIQLSIPFCSIKSDLLKKLIDKKRVYSCCHISKGMGIVFDAEFNILPCNHFLGMSMNNSTIHPTEIIDFWNNEEVTAFRKRIACYPSYKCKNCSFWNICGGGCCIRWMILNPQENIHGFAE